MRYRWKAPISYAVTGHDQVVSVTGRDPVTVDNPIIADILVNDCEVFELLDNGMLRFNGGAYFLDSDGVKHPVDADGFVELDPSKFPAEEWERISKELDPVG